MTTQPSLTDSIAAPSAYKILVAMSFDETADAALQEAMHLADRTPVTELHVVHVIGDSPGLAYEDAVSVTERRLILAREVLRQRLESAWREHKPVEVIAHVRPGDPADVIMQAAVDIDADLVIVGSHRRAGLRKLVLGSVAERVLHGSHCAVLIAFPKDYSGTTASPRIDPPCPDCLSTRKNSSNATFWCERHTRPHLEPHIYAPRTEARSSIPRIY